MGQKIIPAPRGLLFPVLDQIGNVANMNWCKFIVGFLHTSLSNKMYNKGCQLHLMLMYVDKLDISTVNLNPVGGLPPSHKFAVCGWTDVAIKLMGEHNIDYSLFGGPDNFSKWMDGHTNASCPSTFASGMTNPLATLYGVGLQCRLAMEIKLPTSSVLLFVVALLVQLDLGADTTTMIRKRYPPTMKIYQLMTVSTTMMTSKRTPVTMAKIEWTILSMTRCLSTIVDVLKHPLDRDWVGILVPKPPKGIGMHKMRTFKLLPKGESWTPLLVERGRQPLVEE